MAAAQLNVVVKWRGTDFSVELDAEATILTLKRKVGELTGVDAKRQKLMGLPAKAAKAADEALLASLGLKAGQRLMMMGSPDEEHVAAESAAAEAHVLQATVLDDLDDIDPHTLETPVEHNPIYLAKIGNRIKSYKPKMLAGPRGGKKCLVLDVDYTLFDHRSPAENARQLGRPYLHEFLTLAYERYDIVIWSATSMKWIELKMQELGLLGHASFKLAMLFCAGAMIGVDSARYGVVDVKPLGVLWGQYAEYFSPANTIMFDDLSRNFLMNPSTGLKIRPCRGMTLAANREADDELVLLSEYLLHIADEPDLSALDHRHWERALRKRRERDGRRGEQ